MAVAATTELRQPDSRGTTTDLPAVDGPVVLAHDYLLVARGAERTFAAIADCFPGAPVAVLLYDPAGMVRTSFLQSVAARQGRFRRFLPLYPLAAEALRLGDARLVVSSSSAFAHGLRPRAGAAHVCYCHSPFRYAWHERGRAASEMPGWARGAGGAVLDASGAGTSARPGG